MPSWSFGTNEKVVPQRAPSHTSISKYAGWPPGTPGTDAVPALIQAGVGIVAPLREPNEVGPSGLDKCRAAGRRAIGKPTHVKRADILVCLRTGKADHHIAVCIHHEGRHVVVIGKACGRVVNPAMSDVG